MKGLRIIKSWLYIEKGLSILGWNDVALYWNAQSMVCGCQRWVCVGAWWLVEVKVLASSTTFGKFDALTSTWVCMCIVLLLNNRSFAHSLSDAIYYLAIYTIKMAAMGTAAEGIYTQCSECQNGRGRGYSLHSLAASHLSTLCGFGVVWHTSDLELFFFLFLTNLSAICKSGHVLVRLCACMSTFLKKKSRNAKKNPHLVDVITSRIEVRGLLSTRYSPRRP